MAQATGTTLDRIAGCLLGGAVGDALGAAVEFDSLDGIRRRFGLEGIRGFAPAYGRLGAITDDTQMTLFTAEGLIRAANRYAEKGVCHPPSVVHRAYVRWLATQDGRRPTSSGQGTDGWLIGVPALHSRRAPGNTCLSALRSGRVGTPEAPINHSKGCGGIMRVAPVGLIGALDPFRLGAEVAALTHGHASGYLSAGVLALVVDRLLRRQSLVEATAEAREVLVTWPDHTECLAALDAAVSLAGEGSPSAEKVERLGGGWVGEEALAIAVYCALVSTNFAEGVRLAVNHSGDSDSTGSLVGSLLGVIHGRSAIPIAWLEAIELRAEIEELAGDLQRCFHGDWSSEATWDRYPGW